MKETSENFIPVLFQVLFGLVVLNIVINFVLHFTRSSKSNVLVTLYWPVLCLYYLFQGMFQAGDVSTVFAYSVGFFPTMLIGKIAFSTIDKKFPVTRFALLMPLAFALTYVFHVENQSFTIMAMPISLLLASMLAYTTLHLNILERHRTTRLQKVFGIINFLHAIHAINYAIFRMDPGSQLWGWIVSFALCNSLAIFLPYITLEKVSLTEKERLQKLVDLKTKELHSSLKVTEDLFKALVHDLSTPLTVIKSYLYLMKEKRVQNEVVLEKFESSHAIIENIVHQVKTAYGKRDNAVTNLECVNLMKCFKELKDLFELQLEQKKIELVIKNELSAPALILAEHVAFTNSVLGNLISNAVKFSPPNSKIEIYAREENNRIVLDIINDGPQIPDEVIQKVMQGSRVPSTNGSLGERGTGFGLSIAKNYIDTFQGQIQFLISPNGAGTLIRMTLNKATAPNDEQKVKANSPLRYIIKS